MKLKKFWPNIMVKDIHQTIDFYSNILGFEHVMTVPYNSEEILLQYDPKRQLVYALMKNGEIELMFQEIDSLKECVPAFQNCCSAEDIGGSLLLYFEVDNIEVLAEKLKSHCPLVKDLNKTFYGMWEIYFRDPNNYVLGFSQPATNN